MKYAVCAVLMAYASVSAGVHIFETASTKARIEVSDIGEPTTVDFTDLASLPPNDGTPIHIVLTDKVSGTDLEMPILSDDLREYIKSKGTGLSGGLDQRNTQLFKTLFKDCNVSRLPLVNNPKPLQRKPILNSGKE